MNVQLHVVDLSTQDELEGAFVKMRQRNVGAVTLRGSLFYVQRQRVADLALSHRLPAVHVLKEYAHAGLL